jgi:hypothetical protein
LFRSNARIARLLDRPFELIHVDADQLSLPFLDLTAMNTASTLLVSIWVTMAPGTLLHGKYVDPVGRQTRRCPLLCLASVNRLFASNLHGLCAINSGEFDCLPGRQQRWDIHFAGI